MKQKVKKIGRPVKVSGEKATRDKIFDAAVDLFAQRGYDGVSIRDIATAAGITEGAVYRHFSSKEAILDAIFTFVESRIYPSAPEASLDAMIDVLPFREILESMPRAMLADTDLTRVTRVMVAEMHHNKKIRAYVQRELFERPVDETEQLFRKLMEKEKIKPCDPRALSTVFISYLVFWYFQTFIFNYGAPRDPDYLEKTAKAQISLFVDLVKLESA